MNHSELTTTGKRNSEMSREESRKLCRIIMNSQEQLDNMTRPEAVQRMQDELLASIPLGGGMASSESIARTQNLARNVMENGASALTPELNHASEMYMSTATGNYVLFHAGATAGKVEEDKEYIIECPGCSGQLPISYIVYQAEGKHMLVNSSTAVPGNFERVLNTEAILMQLNSREQLIPKCKSEISEVYTSLQKNPTLYLKFFVYCRQPEREHQLENNVLMYSCKAYVSGSESLTSKSESEYHSLHTAAKSNLLKQHAKYIPYVMQVGGKKMERTNVHEALTAHKHSLFKCLDTREWSLLSVRMPLCTTETLTLGSCPEYENLRSPFQLLDLTGNVKFVLINQLFADAPVVAVPLDKLNKFDGSNNELCQISAFVNTVKQYGCRWTPNGVTRLDSIYNNKRPPLINTPICNNVNCSELLKKFINSFTSPAPNKKISCGPIEKQVEKRLNEGASMPPGGVEIALALAIHRRKQEIPYTLRPVTTSSFVDQSIDINREHLFTRLKFIQFLGAATGEQFNFDSEATIDCSLLETKVLLTKLVQVFSTDVTAKHFEYLVSGLLYICVNASTDSSFTDLLNIIYETFHSNCEVKDCNEQKIKYFSHEYFICCLLFGMLTTADLLLNCKDDGTIDSVTINCFPADTVRKMKCTSGTIHVSAWKLLCEDEDGVTYDARKGASILPVYTDVSFEFWICFFAMCQQALDRTTVDVKGVSTSDVKALAVKYLKGIADVNGKLFVGHVSKTPSTEQFSSELKQYEILLPNFVSEIPADRTLQNVFTVSVPAAASDGEPT